MACHFLTGLGRERRLRLVQRDRRVDVAAIERRGEELDDLLRALSCHFAASLTVGFTL